MSENIDLFSEFSTLSDEAWRAKVIEDLKGKTFEETLLWKDIQGIEHQPYYRASSIEGNPLVVQIQNAQKTKPSWIIAHQFYFEGDEDKLRKEIATAIENGVAEVVINGLDSERAEKLLDRISDKNKLCFYLENLPQSDAIRFYLDSLGEYLKGNREKLDLEELTTAFKIAKKGERFLLIDGSIYKSAGANVVQEMACVLQHALSYFDVLTDAGLSATEIAERIEFKLSFGNSYFLEIAKGRALRFLISKLYQSYEIDTVPYIWGSGSETHLAHKDAYTNLLRTTTQSMAAVIGNSDKVSSLTFDTLSSPSKLGSRMAKNILLILSKEAYLSEVADMAKGSYYIESLSVELAEKAWDEFLKMEEEGGLISLFETGKLQAEFDKSWAAEIKTYQEGKAMIGVNKFMNEEAETLEIKERKNKGGLKNYLLATEIE